MYTYTGHSKTFFNYFLTLSHIWDSIVDFFATLNLLHVQNIWHRKIILLIQFDFKFNEDLPEQNTVLITITCKYSSYYFTIIFDTTHTML